MANEKSKPCDASEVPEQPTNQSFLEHRMDVASNTNHTVEAGTLVANPQTDEKGPFAESLELTQKEARISMNSELLPDQKKPDATTSSQNWGGLRPKTPCPRATRPSRQDVLKTGFSKPTFSEKGRRNEKVGMSGRENKSDGTNARKQQEIPATPRMSEGEKASEYSGYSGITVSGQSATPGTEERVRKGFCHACAATGTPTQPLETTMSKTRDKQANSSAIRVGLDGQARTATPQRTESKNLGIGQPGLTRHQEQQALMAQKLTSKASGTKEEQQNKHAIPVSCTPQSFDESRKKLPVEECDREQNQPRGLLTARLPLEVSEVKIESRASEQNYPRSLQTLSTLEEPAVSTARGPDASQKPNPRQENVFKCIPKTNVEEPNTSTPQKTKEHPVQPASVIAMKATEEKREQGWREISSAEEHTACSPELRSPDVEQQNHQEFTTARANTPDVKPTALQRLHEDKEVATAKGLSPHSTSASLSQVCDVQDITTAVAKSPDPKPMEFSFASIFPSLFGGSAPTNESSSTPNPAAPLTLPTLAQAPPQFKPPEQPAKPQNSRRDVIQFRSEYANKFALGSEHTVDFFSGSYDDAQREARNSVKLIVVFMHDPSSEESKRFINETLNSSEFAQLVQNHNLLVWGVGNDSEEGKYVAYNLHVYKFPFLAMMCPRADNRFFSVRRITGFTTAEDLVSRLEKAIETVRVDLKDLREQRDKLIEDRRLMQEQEKAYRESIERDKQKMLEAKKAIQEKQEAEERKKQKQREEMERRKLIACQRENLRLQVDESPVSGTTVHVQVRFPSGKKFSKKFALDDSLEKLFTAILCYENCPDFFTVSAGYPRTQVNCAPEWYYIVLSEQLLAEGLAPYKFKPPLTFRAAGFAKPTGVFVNAYGS